MRDFNGAVAVITGSGRGLGRDHALMLASRNCRVVVNDLGVRSTGSASDADPAADVVEEIARLGGEAIADRHDIVTDAEAVIATALSRFGRMDILIRADFDRPESRGDSQGAESLIQNAGWGMEASMHGSASLDGFAHAAFGCD